MSVQPYEQEFQTTIEFQNEVDLHFDRDEEEPEEKIPIAEVTHGGIKFEAHLCLMKRGVAEVYGELESPVFLKNERSKYLFLTIGCNENNRLPDWRCVFTAKYHVDVNDFQSPEVTVNAETSFSAHVDKTRLQIPIMHVKSDVFHTANVILNITIDSWKGFNLPLKFSFDKKTDLTDATLIVEGRPIHVIRANLACVSSYFYNLFFNKFFTDHAKSEFVLSDLAYDDVLLFVECAYPESMSGFAERKLSPDDLEILLELAERFDCSAVKATVERFISGERSITSVLTPARAIYLSDRYKLSSTLSAELNRLQQYGNIAEVTASSFYELMTDTTKDVINKSKIFHEENFSSGLGFIEFLYTENELDPCLAIPAKMLEELMKIVPQLRAVSPDEWWKYGRFNQLSTLVNDVSDAAGFQPVPEDVDDPAAYHAYFFARAVQAFIAEANLKLGKTIAPFPING